MIGASPFDARSTRPITAEPSFPERRLRVHGLPAPAGERIELGAAVIFGCSPLGRRFQRRCCRRTSDA